MLFRSVGLGGDALDEPVRLELLEQLVEGLLADVETFALMALSTLLEYVFRFHEGELIHIREAKYYFIDSFMSIDSNSRKNLEIHQNLNTGDKRNTLISVLDKTNTSMGARLLSKYLERPLINKESIVHRQEIIKGFVLTPMKIEKIRDILKQIYDLERIMGKLSYARANGKDLIALKYSIEKLQAARLFKRFGVAGGVAVELFRNTAHIHASAARSRSEERRVGKECRSRWSPYH